MEVEVEQRWNSLSLAPPNSGWLDWLDWLDWPDWPDSQIEFL